MHHYNSTTHVYILMYSASEWIFPDLWRFINVLLIIIIISFPNTKHFTNVISAAQVTGAVFSKNKNSYVRIFVNMADFYVAAIIRKFVFSKALRIFAATNFVFYVRKSREGLFALQRAQSQISWMFCRFSSAHMFWQ